MPKMHYFSNKFSKIAKRDLTKLGFLSWLWRDWTLKNQIWHYFSDVIAITSPIWRHQNNVTIFFSFLKYWVQLLFNFTPVSLGQV